MKNKFTFVFMFLISSAFVEFSHADIDNASDSELLSIACEHRMRTKWEKQQSALEDTILPRLASPVFLDYSESTKNIVTEIKLGHESRYFFGVYIYNPSDQDKEYYMTNLISSTSSVLGNTLGRVYDLKVPAKGSLCKTIISWRRSELAAIDWMDWILIELDAEGNEIGFTQKKRITGAPL